MLKPFTLFIFIILSQNFLSQDIDYKKVFEITSNMYDYGDELTDLEISENKKLLIKSGNEDKAKLLLKKEDEYVEISNKLNTYNQKAEIEFKNNNTDPKKTPEYKAFKNLVNDLNQQDKSIRAAKKLKNLSQTTYNLCVFNNGQSRCSQELNDYNNYVNSYNTKVRKYKADGEIMLQKQKSINNKIIDYNNRLREYKASASIEKQKLEQEKEKIRKERNLIASEILDEIANQKNNIQNQAKRDEEKKFEEFMETIKPYHIAMKKHFSNLDLDSSYYIINEYFKIEKTFDFSDLGIKHIQLNNRDFSYQKHAKHIRVYGYENSDKKEITYYAFYDAPFLYSVDLDPKSKKIIKLISQKRDDKTYNDLNKVILLFEYYDDYSIKVKNKLIGNNPVKVIKYNKNGTINVEYNYSNGEKTGLTKWYNENGEVYKEGTYFQGKLEGVLTHYYNDGTYTKINLVEGKKEGKTTHYFKSDSIKGVQDYSGDKLNGDELWYYENGQLRYHKYHEDGKLMELIATYDKEGKEVDKGTLKDGNGTRFCYKEEDGSFDKIQNYIDGKLQKD